MTRGVDVPGAESGVEEVIGVQQPAVVTGGDHGDSGGESSRLAAAPAVTTVSEVEALTRAVDASSTAWPRVSASSRMWRAIACTGTPPESESAWWKRMLKCTPRPALLTPILPAAPNSVNSFTVRPSRGVSSCSRPSGTSESCQSHVCIVSGRRPAGANTAVEHSPSGPAGRRRESRYGLRRRPPSSARHRRRRRRRRTPRRGPAPRRAGPHGFVPRCPAPGSPGCPAARSAPGTARRPAGSERRIGCRGPIRVLRDRPSRS